MQKNLLTNGQPLRGILFRTTVIPPVKTGGYLQCVSPGRFVSQATTVCLQAISKPPGEIATIHTSGVFRE